MFSLIIVKKYFIASLVYTIKCVKTPFQEIFLHSLLHFSTWVFLFMGSKISKFCFIVRSIRKENLKVLSGCYSNRNHFFNKHFFTGVIREWGDKISEILKKWVKIQFNIILLELCLSNKGLFLWEKKLRKKTFLHFFQLPKHFSYIYLYTEPLYPSKNKRKVGGGAYLAHEG